MMNLNSITGYRTLYLMLLFILSCFYFTPANAAENLPVIKPILSCDQLKTHQFIDESGNSVKINKTEILPTSQGSFCKISATLSPDIGVEVALPQEKWTQRLLQVGCGGLCGNINLSLSNASGCTPAMNGEFVVSATNMGHSGGMMDASWAEDPQKRIDFAYRANHVVAEFTKSLVNTYYGKKQKYAYFMGCSDGGREALIEAQRYPTDFNGISAGAPAAWFSMQNSFFHGWNVFANLRKDGTPILLSDRLNLLHQAIIKHCPTLSGVNDGILQNPFSCTFSQSWIKRCSLNQKDKSDCMTKEELDVVEKLYQGAYSNDGQQFAPAGLPIGSELRWPVPSTKTGTSMSAMMALPALKYVLFPNTQSNLNNITDFAFDSQNFLKIAELAPLYNATNTNLSKYQQSGGKLIIWHGLSDDSISPAGTIDYFRGVQQYLGENKTDSFARLFLLPGVAHCGNGEGPDQVDLLTALMDWTEKGTAPKKLIVGKRVQADSMPVTPPSTSSDKLKDQKASAQFHGVQKASIPVSTVPEKVTMTRPVFPYPYIAVYIGKGDVNDAKNYRAVKSNYDNVKLNKPISDMIGPNNQHTYKVLNDKLMQE